MIESEPQVRFIGYGAMLMESFVAVMAIIAASIIDPGLYYAMNAPAAVVGDSVQSASQAVNELGFAISPGELQAAAADVEEESLIARTGGAPTLAIGMSQIFSGATGESLKAFWYHFAIMFEALFILTTVDAGTRVGRFMLQDTLGNVWKPIGRVSWKPGLWATSAIVVGAWGYFLYVGVTDPLGGINQLFPLFGIANQLLAAVALTVCHDAADQVGAAEVGVGDGHPARLGRRRDADRELPEGVLATTRSSASSPSATRYKEALDAGEVLPPATSADDMQKIVTNSTVDGVLAALFAVLIIIVILDAVARSGSRRSARASRCRPPRCRPSRRGSSRRPGCSGPPRSARCSPSAGGNGDGAGSGRFERATARSAGTRLAMTLREAFAGVRWYLREVSGESAYDRYVEHMRRDHPDQPVMSRRDYERRRMRMRDENPRARC